MKTSRRDGDRAPYPQPRKRAAYLSYSSWAGLADPPGARVPLPRRNPETPLEILALLSQGGRGGAGSGVPGVLAA